MTMRCSRRGPRKPWGVPILMALVMPALPGCHDRGDDPSATSDKTLDVRLRTHVVLPSTPTPEGLAYVEGVAKLHAEADLASDPSQVAAIMRRGLAMPVPKGLDEAQILRLEMAARLGEALSARDEGAQVVRDLLAPMLAPERSLPLDAITARALVVFGDAAVALDDHALAVGSYARAIRLMSMLRQELEG